VASEAALDFWEPRVQGRVSADQPSFLGPRGSGLDATCRGRSGTNPGRKTILKIPAESRSRLRGGSRIYRRPGRKTAGLFRDRSRLRFATAACPAYVRGDRRGGRYVFDPARPSAACWRGHVHHVPGRLKTTSSGLARAAGSRGRDADAGHRTANGEVRVLPRAQRRAVRDRHHGGRASRWTRTPRILASAWLRPKFESRRDSSRSTLTPIHAPAAVRKG